MLELENWKYYNPNPDADFIKDASRRWKNGDCIVRSICKVTGQSWEDIYWALCKCGFEVYDVPSSEKAETNVMNKLGFTKTEMKPMNGKYPTVSEIANRYKEFLIVCHSSDKNHLVACKSGNYYDSWDCGNLGVDYIWELKKKINVNNIL